MTTRDGATPDFNLVVEILERRARFVLARWTRLGTHHVRITGGGRIGDDELRERFTRLRGAADALSGRLDALSAGVPRVGNAPSIPGLIDEARAALAFTTFSTLPEPVVEARLEDAWAALLEIAAQIEATLTRAAEPVGDGLRLLTPTELDALSEIEAEDGGDPAPLRRLARMAALLDDVGRAASESRAVLAGRFHRLGGRGRPELIRGRRLAAHLLGAAEGLKLRPSRNRLPTRDGPGRSAADAVLSALARCSDVEDPIERAILAECPRTFEAIEVRLIPACRPGDGDPLLTREREDGRRWAVRWG